MLDQLTTLITYLIVVSIAAERATERATDILKRAFILKFKVENFNGALYQLTAGVFGMVIAYFDKPSFDFITTNHTLLLVIIGLCVSGGSGAWNTILNILKELSQPKTTKD